MLPTKGYFQDIECPYFNSSCGRPYCHFRHRKKQAEHVEEVVEEAEKEAASVPTYRPTPKSQLANIHSRSHIPISYVPDLAFRHDKKLRSKIENPTYNPTPLSILSSANKRNLSLNEENKKHLEVINEIKQNIANVEYDPTVSLQNVADIDFEDLSNEFDLIDEIINDKKVNTEIESREDEEPVAAIATNSEKVLQKEILKEPVNSSNNKEEVVISSVNSEKSQKTEKNTSKQNKECDSSKKKETESLSAAKNNKKDSQKPKTHRNSSESKEKVVSNTKESELHKKSDKKDKSRHKSKSPSQEKVKPKEKSHKEKHKSKDKDSSKKNKSNEDSKGEHRSKEKHKTRETDKPDKELSKSKNEKRHSLEKTDRSNHRKNKEKEKGESKERSHSCSKEPKNSKKVSENKKSSHSHSKEHTSTKEKPDEKEKTSSKRKEHTSSKDSKKRKRNDKDKSKNKEREKSKESTSEESERKRVAVSNPPNMDTSGFNFLDSNPFESDSDIDVNEDETMEECYRIFNEYTPSTQSQPNLAESQVPEKIGISVNNDDNLDYQAKKRIAHSNVENPSSNFKYTYNKPKSVPTPGQILANRYKLAKLAQANREQELLINEMNQQSLLAKKPAPSLLEAARERKKLKEMEQKRPSSNLIDDILQGKTHTTSVAQKIAPKKIAPAQNVWAITKAKERISKIKQTSAPKTLAQTQKSNRIAHVPDVSLSDIPDVLHADKSKLPVNVRTRFLTMIADECVKLYISKDDAYGRALREEFNCYEKCKVLTSYRNSAMLAVNRLRKEVMERNVNGLGLIGAGEDMGEGSGSEKKAVQFYDKVLSWVLTEEELDLHGYPRQADEYGVAIIKNFKSSLPSNLDENQRFCSRCHKLYQVDDDGWPLYEEECCYHPMKKRTIRGEQTYLCCRSSDESGCATSDTHVHDGFTSAILEGFQTTMESEFEGDTRSSAVYALDCEMCYTTKGLELTRVTIVDTDCKTVYETFVKPLNPIIDYNTRFSGITKEQMDRTSTSILQVQANVLHLCNSRTILVGHSLESDMKALKIVHSNVIDTAVLFPHKMGLPHKRALRALASEYLRKIIQNDVSGHDSAEDAVTCMELLKWKLKEETKRKSK